MESKQKSAPRGEGKRRVPPRSRPVAGERPIEEEKPFALVEVPRSALSLDERRARRAERRRKETAPREDQENRESEKPTEPMETVTINPIVPILWLVVPLVLLVLWTFLERWFVH